MKQIKNTYAFMASKKEKSVTKIAVYTKIINICY